MSTSISITLHARIWCTIGPGTCGGAEAGEGRRQPSGSALQRSGLSLLLHQGAFAEVLSLLQPTNGLAILGNIDLPLDDYVKEVTGVALTYDGFTGLEGNLRVMNRRSKFDARITHNL